MSFSNVRDVERSIEEQYRERILHGKVLKPTDPSCEMFLSSLEGTVHPAVDARGFDVGFGRLTISVQDANTEQNAPSLNLRELYIECFEAHRSFLKTYAKVLHANNDEDADAVADSPAQTKVKTFQDVKTVIDTACEHLKNKQQEKNERKEKKTLAGRLYKAFCAFRDQAKNIETFLNVLPSGSEYTSFICGALAVVFSAIDRHETFGANVCHAVDEIRAAIGNQEYAAHIYRDDPKVHEYMSSVCASIFEILGYILNHLEQSTVKRILKPLMKPATYGEELPELIVKLRERNQGLNRRAEILFQTRSKKAYEEISNLSIHQQRMNISVSDTLGNVYSQLSTQLLLYEKRITEKLDRLESREKKSKRRPPRLRGPAASFDVDKLLDKLDYRYSLLEDDCAGILRGYHLAKQDERKIAALTGNTRLRSFVEVNRSAVLLVLGGNSSRDAPRSAISHVNATMVEALNHVSGREKAICVLAYFCGEHRDDGAEFSSPWELIITLVLQLLEQCGRDIDPQVLIDANIMETCQEGEVEDLCELLGTLLRALPDETVVFCILDGISFFESPRERGEEMAVIVEFLLHQARRRQRKMRGAKLKALFAAPSGCDELHEMFESYEIMTVHSGSRSGKETLLDSQPWGSSGLHDSILALSDNDEAFD